MKQTRKAMKASIINELSKQYKEKYDNKIENYQILIKTINDDIKKFRKENIKLKEENETLKNKVQQYEDWINRLQEWCNLSNEEREQAIKKYNMEKENAQIFKYFYVIQPYFNLFFNI